MYLFWFILLQSAYDSNNGLSYLLVVVFVSVFEDAGTISLDVILSEPRMTQSQNPTAEGGATTFGQQVGYLFHILL